MRFSRKQQQIIGLFCVLYGLWFLASVLLHGSEQTPVEGVRLSLPEPPDFPFYIDPPIDVNTATAAELQFLPAIGPVLATRILAYREAHGPFRSLAALREVKGVGPKTLHKLHFYLQFPEDRELCQ